LEDESFVFAIVIRFNDLPGSPLRSYVLKHWEHLVGGDAEAEASYVVDLIYDLRQHSHAPELRTEHFLAQIENLDVGPVRTVAAETRSVRNLGLLYEDFSTSPDLSYRTASELESVSRTLTWPDKTLLD